EENEGFRIGGRGWGGGPAHKPQRGSSGMGVQAPPDFYPDGPAGEAGGALVGRGGPFFAGGALRLLLGGGGVELRSDCRPLRPRLRPAVGFMLRDRLGQGLFGDHTHTGAGAVPPRLETGRAFSASFHFRFPYLLSGEYALEAAVYEGTPEENRILARLRDTTFLSMQSRHPGGGLVNILANAIGLTVDTDMPVRASARPTQRAMRQS